MIATIDVVSTTKYVVSTVEDTLRSTACKTFHWRTASANSGRSTKQMPKESIMTSSTQHTWSKQYAIAMSTPDTIAKAVMCNTGTPAAASSPRITSILRQRSKTMQPQSTSVVTSSTRERVHQRSSRFWLLAYMTRSASRDPKILECRSLRTANKLANAPAESDKSHSNQASRHGRPSQKARPVLHSPSSASSTSSISSYTKTQTASNTMSEMKA
mmetsp:Transcript_23243/g.43276  ORF Transcript_23243/g.43276 Transcript_23243/m.43276 type:complete len:215 (-) Transcript_23243:486-1130(-)